MDVMSKRRAQQGLASVRQARGRTQLEVAQRAGFKQGAVSRLERHADDAKVSTLRRYVESLGGELRVVAVFRGEELVLKLDGGASE